MKEIIWVHIGQAGIQIGIQFWKQMMAEHGINSEGKLIHTEYDHDPNVLFSQTEDDRFVPRAIFADWDQITIEWAMKSIPGQLMNTNQFIYSKEEAAGVFSRAWYTEGRK